jgi:hypothetical protein
LSGNELDVAVGTVGRFARWPRGHDPGEADGVNTTVPEEAAQLLSRANEARAVAALVVNPESRLMMLRIARCYEQLAELTAKAAAGSLGKERAAGCRAPRG